jgi:hypothetical protein
MKRLWLILALAALPGPASAQGRDEWFHYPGGFNWSFLAQYPEAARLFNAFDYGHAVLYEQLWSHPAGAKARLESVEFTFLTADLLRRPPRFAIVEDAVMPRYAALARRAKLMFDWAHELHRQIYDVYSDERISPADKPALVERITDYYLSNRALAFAPVTKSMALMDDAYYSQIFRRDYPKFNGLIWAYHWLQVGLYEPLLGANTPAERKRAVGLTLGRFWAMVDGSPPRFPEVMPMTSAVAPRFAARHPRAAAIFDNLHMMHDIISDILASDRVSRDKKAREIEAALDEFRNGSRNTMSPAEAREMVEMMGGVEKMGGVAWTPPIR